MDDKQAFEASCHCGQLRVEVTGEALRISVCHCYACQRRTGSAFGVQARFPEERVRTIGRSRSHERVADSGNTLRFHFCPDCGSTVYWYLDEAPGTVAVAVGAFADTRFPGPRISVYESRRHPWVHLLGDIEHSD